MVELIKKYLLCSKCIIIKQLREEILRLLAQLREIQDVLSKYFDAAQAHRISVLNASSMKMVNELDGTDLLQLTEQMVSSTLWPVEDRTLAQQRRAGGRQYGWPTYILEDQIQLLNSFARLEADIPAPVVSSDPGSTWTASSHPGAPSTAQPVADQRKQGFGTSSIPPRIQTPSAAAGTCAVSQASLGRGKPPPSCARSFCSPSSFPIGFHHDHHHRGQLDGERF
jgi:hypothetical protein